MIELKKVIGNLGCHMYTVNNFRRHNYVKYRTTKWYFLPYSIATICYRKNVRYRIQSICVAQIVASVIINSKERVYS